MSTISTHVLDTAVGRPAAGIAVTLFRLDEHKEWQTIASGQTDGDGRISDLLTAGQGVAPGVYQLLFTTGYYFAARGETGFYPVVPIIFQIERPGDHFHVPLLLSPYGYTTYRGS